jgi:hypothetical protein
MPQSRGHPPHQVINVRERTARDRKQGTILCHGPIFFHIRTVRDLFVDPDGSEMTSLSAARTETLIALRCIVADRLRRGDRLLDVQQIEIADAAERTLASIPLQDALGRMH